MTGAPPAVDPFGTVAPAPGTLLDLFVYGRPRPKGSMRAVSRYKMVEQVEGSSEWKEHVAENIVTMLGKRTPFEGPVWVTLKFYMPRTVGKGGKVWESHSGRFPTEEKGIGDLDKLTRNILDALQLAGVVKNDSQVIQLVASKEWADEVRDPGVQIRVTVEPTWER